MSANKNVVSPDHKHEEKYTPHLKKLLQMNLHRKRWGMDVEYRAAFFLVFLWTVVENVICTPEKYKFLDYQALIVL